MTFDWGAERVSNFGRAVPLAFQLSPSLDADAVQQTMQSFASLRFVENALRDNPPSFETIVRAKFECIFDAQVDLARY